MNLIVIDRQKAQLAVEFTLSLSLPEHQQIGTVCPSSQMGAKHTAVRKDFFSLFFCFALSVCLSVCLSLSLSIQKHFPLPSLLPHSSLIQRKLYIYKFKKKRSTWMLSFRSLAFSTSYFIIQTLSLLSADTTAPRLTLRQAANIPLWARQGLIAETLGQGLSRESHPNPLTSTETLQESRPWMPLQQWIQPFSRLFLISYEEPGGGC